MGTVYPLSFGAGMPHLHGSGFAPQTHDLSHADDATAWVFQPVPGITITRLGVYIYSGFIVGTSPTYRLSLQSVNSSGEPTGTILGGGSPASATSQLNDNTGAGGWNWLDLDNSYTPSGGVLIAMVIEYSSGTIDGSNYATITHSLEGPQFKLPYSTNNDDGGGWNKYEGWPQFGYGTASAKYGWLNLNKLTVNLATVSAGHRIALQFELPASRFGATYQVAGFRCAATLPSSDDIVYAIWNAAGTVLQSGTIAGGNAAMAGGGDLVTDFMFETPATLNYGTDYYVGFEQDDTETIAFHALLSEASELGTAPWGPYASGADDTGSGWNASRYVPFVDLLLWDSTLSGGSGSAGRLIGPSVLIG